MCVVRVGGTSMTVLVPGRACAHCFRACGHRCTAAQIIIPGTLGSNDRSLRAQVGEVRVTNGLMPADPTALLPSNSQHVPALDPLAHGVVMEKFVVVVEGLAASYMEGDRTILPPILQSAPTAMLNIVLIQPLNAAEKCVSSVQTQVRLPCVLNLRAGGCCVAVVVIVGVGVLSQVELSIVRGVSTQFAEFHMDGVQVSSPESVPPCQALGL